MTSLRVALIGGAGFMGKAHSIGYALAPVMAQLDVAVEKAVLVDATAEGAAKAAAELGWRESSDDWRATIARDDIDIVDIVTPPHLHAPIAREAIAHGKHVFIEKPITNSAEEAAELAALVAASGTVGQVGYNYRHTPAITFARKLIDEGRLGTPLAFRATYLQDGGFFNGGDFGWRNTKASGGSGASGDIGSHIIDIAEYLNGEIVAVCGQLRAITNPPTGWVPEDERIGADLVDHAAVWLARFANGSIGTFAVSFYASGRKNLIRWELDGTAGALEFDWNRREALGISLVDDPAELSGFRSVLSSEKHANVWYPVGGLGLGYSDGTAIQLQQFVSSISRRKAAHPGFAEAAHSEAVIHAVEESARTGRWIDVPRTTLGALDE